MIMSWFSLYRIVSITSRQVPHSLYEYTYNTDCVFEINEHFQATDLFPITLCLSRNLKYNMTVFLQMLADRDQLVQCLQAGRSGDGIPVGTIYSAPIQKGPGAQPNFCAVGNDSFSRG
jgi:hypothetical protein